MVWLEPDVQNFWKLFSEYVQEQKEMYYTTVKL